MLLSIGEFRIREESIEWTRTYIRDEERRTEVGLTSGKILLLLSDTGAPELEDYLSSIEIDLDSRLVDAVPSVG